MGDDDGAAKETDAAVPDAAVTLDAQIGDPSVTPQPAFTSDIFRQSAAMAVLPDGRVLVVGGMIVRGPPGGGPGRVTGMEAAELYDVAQQQIDDVDPLNEGRLAASAVALADGTVLVAGGRGGPDGEVALPRATAEVFDPADGSFTLTAQSMNHARAGHNTRLLSSGPHAGKVLIVGGVAPAAPELYDPATGQFTLLGATNAPPGGAGFALPLDDGRVFYGAAQSADESHFRDCHMYDVATGTFSMLSELGSDRNRQTFTVLRDGRVLIAGGFESTGVDTVELFDPDTGEFKALALTGPRFLHAAGVLGNSGRVALVSGLTAPAEYTGTVEIFDPVTETFELAAGEVGVPRVSASTVTLADGRVLVLGGQITIGSGPNTAIVSSVDIISE